jgi:HD-GYP domain-containing protein (c-di-GMP phosphodiesterase class II)
MDLCPKGSDDIQANHLDSILAERLSSIKLLSKSEYLKTFAASWPNPSYHVNEEVQESLDNLTDSNPYIQAVYLMNREGEVILSSVENVGDNYGFRPYFQQAIAGNTYISDISISVDAGIPVIYFSAPIEEEDGTINAIALLRVHAEEIWSIVEMEKDTLGPGSVAIIFDEFGMRIAHASDHSLIFKTVVPIDPQLEAQLLAGHRLGTMNIIESTNFSELAAGLSLVESQPHFTYHLDTSDDIYHASKAKMAMKPWTVIQTVPEPSFLSSINQIKNITIFITLLVGIFIMVIIALFSLQITRPVKQLTASAKRIAAGELDHTLHNLKIPQEDEIGVLFRSIRGMQSSLIESYSDLKDSYMATIEALSSALDSRDRETEGHSRRVTSISIRIGKTLGLDSSECQALKTGALLHDVGKIGISDTILHKPGPLTEQEWEIMKQHPLIGNKILKDVKFLKDSLPVVLSHHEKFDGSGYPYGLIGEDIPLIARIFALADAYDAITSDRPYRKAKSHEEAVAEIKRSAGTHFDPSIVEVFIKLYCKEL